VEKLNLEFLRPIIRYIPEIKLPRRHIPFKEKLMWSALILALFFIMGTIYPIKVTPASLPPQYQQMSMIFASKIGSIISVGIGPIVTASIILQLLIGSKMIDLDMSKTENKALFQGTQKILTIVIAFFEAAAIVYGFGLSAEILQDGTRIFHHPLVELTILQIALGSILLMYMDEIVSKWGIGSGIGLFIAGGVSQEIITASFNFLRNEATGRFYGIIPNFIELVLSGTFQLELIVPLVATVIIFLIVVFGESMRLEIPLSYGGIRGVGGRYPLKFFYVSNIPVILAAALLMNVTMWTKFVGVDIYNPSPIEEMNILQKVIYYIASNVTLGNLNSIVPESLFDIVGGNMPRIFDFSIFTHLIIYLSVFIGLCVLFGKFWVETTGLGAEQVAEQIQRGGMQIPGFRRDQRVIERVLNRYIPQITIISSIAVGLLAAGADLLGAIGSGTGILLTVGILYRLYEEIQREQMSEMHPAFRRFMGRG
jgi:preprotein translocase subunit SecY